MIKDKTYPIFILRLYQSSLNTQFFSDLLDFAYIAVVKTLYFICGRLIHDRIYDP